MMNYNQIENQLNSMCTRILRNITPVTSLAFLFWNKHSSLLSLLTLSWVPLRQEAYSGLNFFFFFFLMKKWINHVHLNKVGTKDMSQVHSSLMFRQRFKLTFNKLELLYSAYFNSSNNFRHELHSDGIRETNLGISLHRKWHASNDHRSPSMVSKIQTFTYLKNQTMLNLWGNDS